MTENDPERLFAEMTRLSAEIVAMSAALQEMDDGPEKKALRRKRKDMQYQVLFYISKIINTANAAIQQSRER